MNTARQPKRIYITKWALTDGIVVKTMLVDEKGYASNIGAGGSLCIARGHYALTQEEALGNVRKMIAAKRKAMAKAASKLQRLEESLATNTFKIAEE